MAESASERAARRWREKQGGVSPSPPTPPSLDTNVTLRSVSVDDREQLEALAAMEPTAAWVDHAAAANQIAIKAGKVIGIAAMDLHGGDAAAAESGWLRCFCVSTAEPGLRHQLSDALACSIPSAPVFTASSAADERARALASERGYELVGATCTHSFLRGAMRRADRTAAAACLDVLPLLERDLDDACAFLQRQTPPCVLVPSRECSWRGSSRAAVADKCGRARSFVVRKRITQAARAEAEPAKPKPELMEASDGGAPAAPILGLFFAFDPDEVDQRPRPRLYSCIVAPELDAGAAAAALLAFATCASAAVAGAEAPPQVAVVTGPFLSDSGGDVEPRVSQALAAANFTRDTGPATRVYRLPRRE